MPANQPKRVMVNEYVRVTCDGCGGWKTLGYPGCVGCALKRTAEKLKAGGYAR